MTDSCQTCKFYFLAGRGYSSGYCRRYPPRLEQVKKVNSLAIRNVYNPPVVHADSWCGEFQEKTDD